MPINKSAKKRVRQAEKRREKNRSIKNEVKTHIKKTEQAIEEKNQEQADENLSLAFKKLDKAVKYGVFHKNKSANKKSKLSSYYNKVFK